MKALITLAGLPFDKPKSVLNVEYTNKEQLITKLKELQSGYSVDGKDKPRIKNLKVPSKRYPGKMRIVIDCYTEADWHHVAHINVISEKKETLILSMPVDLCKGDRFKSIHMPAEYTIEVSSLTGGEAERNELLVWIYKGDSIDNSDGSWTEEWDLQNTLRGFERTEYHSLTRKNK